jgi:hypothetical protein
LLISENFLRAIWQKQSAIDPPVPRAQLRESVHYALDGSPTVGAICQNTVLFDDTANFRLWHSTDIKHQSYEVRFGLISVEKHQNRGV